MVPFYASLASTLRNPLVSPWNHLPSVYGTTVNLFSFPSNLTSFHVYTDSSHRDTNLLEGDEVPGWVLKGTTESDVRPEVQGQGFLESPFVFRLPRQDFSVPLSPISHDPPRPNIEDHSTETHCLTSSLYSLPPS